MSRRSGIAALKASRAGEKRSNQWQKSEGDRNKDIYDVVDEKTYKGIVKGRLQDVDFVVGDEGFGYADHGEERWDEEDANGDSDEVDSEEERKERRRAKKAVLAKAKAAKPKPRVEELQETSASAYKKAIPENQEHDFMANLLSTMDTTVIPTASTSSSRPGLSKKRKSSTVLNSSDWDNQDANPDNAHDFHTYRSRDDENGGYGDAYSSDGADPSSEPFQSSPFKPSKKAKIEPLDVDFGASSDGMELDNDDEDEFDKSFDDIDFSDLQFDDDGKIIEEKPEVKPAIHPKAKPALPLQNNQYLRPVTGKGVKPAEDVKFTKLEADPGWLKIDDDLLANTESADFDALGPLGATSKSAAPLYKPNALEEDGTFRFFWLDYLELEGRVYFVGKAFDKTAAKEEGRKPWVSCCVMVGGIQRNLFIKPRRWALDDDDEETDVPADKEDVYRDFDRIRKKAKIKSWGGKFVKRRYVLDDPGDEETAGEQEWLKAVYGFDEPQISTEIKTPNIEKVYGANTSAFEILTMKRKIMGPCWLLVKNPVVSDKGVSWCKLEIEIDDPKNINPFLDTDPKAPKEIPPMTVVSLSLRTIVNHVTSSREIVCATARFWEDMNFDDPTPPEKLRSSVHTVVRCLDKFPTRFEETAKSQTPAIMTMRQEKVMLASLLATIKKYDPDVIIGHDFLGVSLDVLLHRLKSLGVEAWSALGRFRRSKWPNIGRQGSNIRFLQGRLLCDLASDAAKSMITSTTWSLTEMCASQLEINRPEIDPEDTASYFDSTVSSPDRLLEFVKHGEKDAYLQMAISSKVQMLPLTRQLTSLAGNSWNKTLNGGRAERNEYILLHEFHRLKYICPDKTWGKKAATAVVKAEAAEDGDPNTAVGTTTKGKRDKYKGGLVFEPKRGLWDKYILVMDFNSLYPSIIQEYNIDFTTVAKPEIGEDGEEKIPDVPDPDIKAGVLPRLIANLVDRRKLVKNLMKNPKATPAQMMQWDIRQKALKLTANSMYGCLGFEYSRFYARPLAALTTFKGREILTHTKELAESLQLDVVYGDTDSVFVNSNVDNFPEALKMANMFKKHVNDRYKLLEIDLDGVFQRLLLLQKKKYAAVKVESLNKTSIEIKGLDMKRREYCNMSKNVSKQVLDYILSGEETEVVVEKIHAYLQEVGHMLKEENILPENKAKMMEDLTIFKRLGKNPEDYPGDKALPHVQVALRIKARGGSAKAGDVIPYLFCLGPDGETSRTAQSDRARHPDEVRRGGEDVKIDYEFYIGQQILPPIERLCEPIEGTDRSRIAECLGLDASRYHSASNVEAQDQDFTTFESRIPDKERFKDADPLVVQCLKCEGSFQFTAVGSTEAAVITASGPVCPSCEAPVTNIRLQATLELQIRRHISRYYEGWMVCDEQTCQHRTRSMGVYGRRCLQPDCSGSVSPEYSNLQLYSQLLYYAWLFDGAKAISNANGSSRQDEVNVLVRLNQGFLDEAARVVQKYLGECGRRWVGLENLFSFMKLS